MSPEQARKKVAKAIRLGRLVKPTTCPRCGATPSSGRMHAHHHDYAYPLRIEWLCGACHSHDHGRSC